VRASGVRRGAAGQVGPRTVYTIEFEDGARRETTVNKLALAA